MVMVMMMMMMATMMVMATTVMVMLMVKVMVMMSRRSSWRSSRKRKLDVDGFVFTVKASLSFDGIHSCQSSVMRASYKLVLCDPPPYPSSIHLPTNLFS